MDLTFTREIVETTKTITDFEGNEYDVLITAYNINHPDRLTSLAEEMHACCETHCCAPECPEHCYVIICDLGSCIIRFPAGKELTQDEIDLVTSTVNTHKNNL